MRKRSEIGPSTPVTMYREDVELLDSFIEVTGKLNTITIEEGRARAEWISRKVLIFVRKDCIHKFTGNGKESFYRHQAKPHVDTRSEVIMMYQQDCDWLDELAQKMGLLDSTDLPERKAQIAARKELFHRLVCHLDEIFISKVKESIKEAQKNA